MTFKCLDQNRNINEVSWIYLKNAWVPVVTVCDFLRVNKTNAIANEPINEVIPDILNLSLISTGSFIIVSWELNFNYKTEIRYRYGNNNWEIVIVEGNETAINKPRRQRNSSGLITFEITARFTNNYNYSNNYNTKTIEVRAIR